MDNKNPVKSVLTDDDKRNLNLAVLSETTNVMNPIEYEQIKKLAKDFWISDAVSTNFKNETQIVVAMLSGREMGMTFSEAMSDLYFVGGKLNVYGKGTPSALRRKDWRISYSEETPESCTATIINVKTDEEITDTFTFQEAEQSGFTKDSNGKLKIGWVPGANRRRKLRYGVLSLIIHTYVPEVLGAATGIGEYSEDYIEGEIASSEKIKADKQEITRARIAAAEAKRDEMAETPHKPKAVKNQVAGTYSTSSKPQSVMGLAETLPADPEFDAIEQGTLLDDIDIIDIGHDIEK